MLSRTEHTLIIDERRKVEREARVTYLIAQTFVKFKQALDTILQTLSPHAYSKL